MTHPTYTLIALDFEATCDEQGTPSPQEIIEFPAIALDAAGARTAEFHHYVRPQFHPLLSTFCTQLTGIEQSTVDAGVTFLEALTRFEGWLAEQGAAENGLVVTCGDWDLATLLPQQCAAYGVALPAWARRRVNLKKVFRAAMPGATRVRGLEGMVEALGMQFEGRAHSGIVDTRNICRVIAALIARGASFAPPATVDPHEAAPVTGVLERPVHGADVSRRP